MLCIKLFFNAPKHHVRNTLLVLEKMAIACALEPKLYKEKQERPRAKRGKDATRLAAARLAAAWLAAAWLRA